MLNIIFYLKITNTKLERPDDIEFKISELFELPLKRIKIYIYIIYLPFKLLSTKAMGFSKFGGS